MSSNVFGKTDDQAITIKGIVLMTAIAIPCLGAAYGYGVLYQKVDSISTRIADDAQWRQRTEETLNRLDRTLVGLTVSIENMPKRN